MECLLLPRTDVTGEKPSEAHKKKAAEVYGGTNLPSLQEFSTFIPSWELKKEEEEPPR